jgi:hypothetical protein
MRYLNKVASWITIYVIYLIIKVQEFWEKLNKKALVSTVVFWVLLILFVKYFEYIVIWGIFIGFPLFILYITYLAFKDLAK